MRNIFASIAAAISAFFSVFIRTTKWVGGKAVTGTEIVWEVAKGVPGIAFGALSDVVHLPGRLLASVLGGRGGASPQQAQAQGQHEEATREQQADDAADRRAMVQAFRRAAAALSRGEDMPVEATEKLHPNVLAYLQALDRHELETLTRARTAELKKLFDVGEAPDGVRSTREIAAEIKNRRDAARNSKISQDAEDSGEVPYSVSAFTPEKLRRLEIQRQVREALVYGKPSRSDDEDFLDDLEYAHA
jgi:hypothetical protein